MARPRKSYTFFVVRLVLRAVLALFLALLTLFLLWRVFLSGRAPRALRGVAPNAVLAAAMERDGDLTVFYQDEASVTRGTKDRGYFGAPYCRFIENAEEVQVLLRYNNSTLEHTREDFSLSETPPRGVPLFDTTLLLLIDLTPEDLSDNVDGSETVDKVRIAPVSAEYATTKLYTYCRLTFDGVRADGALIAVYLDMYYKDAVDYTKEAYGTLRLYHVENERIAAPLSAKEKEKILSWQNAA